jgi:hypothetical protein
MQQESQVMSMVNKKSITRIYYKFKPAIPRIFAALDEAANYSASAYKSFV